ncbi:AraC family transcriptional regulator [Aurantivibrio plasticivorans]
MASTTLTSWALLVWQTLQEKGLNPRLAFEKAALDPAKLGDGNARYPITGMVKLWDAGLEMYGDETFGMDVGDHWSVTTYHALGYSWLASSSLKEAMQRMARYARIVNSYSNVSLKADGENYTFSFSSIEVPKYAHDMASDAVNVAVLKMSRLLCGQGFSPKAVFVSRKESPIKSALESLFRCPYYLDAPINQWVIDRHSMEMGLPTGNEALAHVNELLALKYMSQLEKQLIVPAVTQYITETLPSGDVSEVGAAESVHMSVRTLQRKLVSEGYRFSDLLAEVRRDLADIYMKNSQLSLGEITHLLGFSEPASFTRAFKRWYGEAPSVYRKSLDVALEN